MRRCGPTASLTSSQSASQFFGACIVKPQTAPNTSVQEPSPRHAEAFDDWVRQHAEKGNKRLRAWVRGDTPPTVEFQIDGNSTSDPTQILASKRQFWYDFLGSRNQCRQ